MKKTKTKKHTHTHTHKQTNKPTVSVRPLEKYTLVDDARMHNEYTPAAAPVSTTVSVIDVADTNTDATLVTALVTLVHTVDDTTNANPSPPTFNNPAPTSATD